MPKCTAFSYSETSTSNPAKNTMTLSSLHIGTSSAPIVEPCNRLASYFSSMSRSFSTGRLSSKNGHFEHHIIMNSLHSRQSQTTEINGEDQLSSPRKPWKELPSASFQQPNNVRNLRLIRGAIFRMLENVNYRVGLLYPVSTF